jgi:hypothetical protein
MNKASNILLSILPSPASEIRRAAAEGLGCLATLGMKEDMHFLQSSVLHSLDELISGAASPGPSRTILQDDIQAGRSGSLLTLACMQRNTYKITERRAARSRLRGSPGGPKDDSEDSLPAIQTMIRLLPYISESNGTTSLAARTSGLHALLLLLEYSKIFKRQMLEPEDLHLLKKAVEVVEDNVVSAWTIASHLLDYGNESTKLAFEASFLAVMLRLMTFLTPHLWHLEEIDSSIAKRFSTMGIIIEELLGFHPVVQCEAMAFFEVLANHQALLPPHSGGIKYDEHPILSSIPFMLGNITPAQSMVLSPGMWTTNRGCQTSLCLRITLKAMRVLGISHILVAEWSDMKVISLLFATLEQLVGRQTYPGETTFRGVAAPRDATSISTDCVASKIEIPALLTFFLYRERESQQNSQSILLRFILLTRAIISGSMSSKGADDEEHTDGLSTTSRAVQTASKRAFLDCQYLFDVSNAVRWQTKAAAAQIADIALHELARNCRQTSGPDLLESASFNPVLAGKEIARARQETNTVKSEVPNSFVSLHIAEVLTASCVAATATVDQVELRILQENAMYLLSNVIGKFAAAPDPNESDARVLSEYVPQISSCIKSALAAKDEQLNEMTSRLFWAGCEALRSFLEKRVSDDRGVLKRIIRPALLSKEEAPFFNADSAMPRGSPDKEDCGVMRSSLLIKIGKIWTLGHIPLSDPDVTKMLEADEGSLGVYAAAMAIDGAKLLISYNMTLVAEAAKEPTSVESTSRFFSFDDSTEIDSAVKAALAKTWANNLRTSVKLLAAAVVADDVSQNYRNECEAWLKLVVPFAFAGLSDAIQAKRSVTNERTTWAKDVDLEDVFSSCLATISIISCTKQLLTMEETWATKIESLAKHLYRYLLLPILIPQPHQSKSSTGGMLKLVTQSCSLLTSVAVAQAISTKNIERPRLLLAILGPLELLQKDELDLSNVLVATIVSACLKATAEIVEAGHGSPNLVKAMLSLVLSISIREEKVPQDVRSTSQNLLKHCVGHESVELTDHSLIATALARNRDWATWSVVVMAKDGIAAEKSLVEVEKALLNPSYAGEQVTALAAIRTLIQSCPPPSVVLGRVAVALGAEILSVFQAYGVLANTSTEIRSQRLTACADCMKILLAFYQQFTGDCSEEEVSQFLEVLFEAFIAIIRFNGLPTHPSPQGKLSDANIGRMCAQAITYVARTTPDSFKTCMNGMADHDRAVLEFAVRADVSGYVVAGNTAPAKKKLILTGFKK